MENVKKVFNEMSVLFPLLTIYTIAYLALMVCDFVAKEAFELPSGLMVVYIALVGAYAADKEIRRWIGKGPQSRKGTIFVYCWLVFFLAAFIVHSFKNEYVMPADLSKVALQVLAIFFGSKASKKIYSLKENSKSYGKEFQSREEKVLAIMEKKGQIRNKEVADYLGVSSSTSERLLDEIEKRGKIKQVGSGRGTHYVLLETSE